MSDIAEFVHSNASKVSPKILHGIHLKLPQLKLEFAEIHAPKYPHLVDQKPVGRQKNILYALSTKK